MKRDEEEEDSFHQCVSYTFFHPVIRAFISRLSFLHSHFISLQSFTSICEKSPFDTQHTLVSYFSDVSFLVSLPSSRCDILDNKKRMKALHKRQPHTPHRHISLA